MRRSPPPVLTFSNNDQFFATKCSHERSSISKVYKLKRNQDILNAMEVPLLGSNNRGLDFETVLHMDVHLIASLVMMSVSQVLFLQCGFNGRAEMNRLRQSTGIWFITEYWSYFQIRAPQKHVSMAQRIKWIENLYRPGHHFSRVNALLVNIWAENLPIWLNYWDISPSPGMSQNKISIKADTIPLHELFLLGNLAWKHWAFHLRQCFCKSSISLSLVQFTKMCMMVRARDQTS